MIQLLCILYFKIYPILWDAATTLCSKVGIDKSHEIIISIVFSAISDGCTMILQIPMSYYHTFSVEVRFGFNNQTKKVCIHY